MPPPMRLLPSNPLQEHELVQPHVIRMDGSLDSVMGLDKQLLLRLLCAAGAAEDSAPGGSGAAGASAS